MTKEDLSNWCANHPSCPIHECCDLCMYEKGRADEQYRILSIVSRCIARNVYNVSEGIALLNEIKEKLKEQKK